MVPAIGNPAAANSQENAKGLSLDIDLLGAIGSETIAETLKRVSSDIGGLSTQEVNDRLTKYGPNTVKQDKRQPAWLQLLGRLRNPLVLTLLIASGLSAAAGDTVSFIIIVVIVALSMMLDFIQEFRARNAVDALQNSVAVQATVRRDGAPVSVPVDRVVPGDIMELIAGDLIPADGRLIESRDLFVNQALLTGESYPVEKQAAATQDTAKSSVGQANIIFAGTSVVSGMATAVVCRTGRNTSLGSLAASLAEKAPATSFEIGIRRFGLLILRFTILLVLFVLVVNIAFHRPLLESLMFALALAVGITPELLPMIITVALSRSAIALSKRKVIVKRLSAIHDIGAMDILCTDKTGTLTEAKIELVRVVDITGAPSDRAFAFVYLNSYFESGMKSPLDDAVLAREFDATGWRKIDEVPFDFERRRVSVLVHHDDERLLLIKGAPEDIIRLSGMYATADGKAQMLDGDVREKLLTQLNDLGGQGYRALGVASRSVSRDQISAAAADESELVFAGFAVFLDPPKASAGATVQSLTKAGVSVKVLTGDNEMVSRHVFSEIGVAVTGALSGDQLTKLSQEALIGQLPHVNLFYRVSPQQKLRILLALKRIGHVVGFMGDGINDAPALHAADIGISVDGAADVARDAADLILLQHDLSVVQDAVMQGRSTVQNVSKYIMMASSSNFGNMFSMAGAALFLPFLPMLPTQVLLNNLLYDVSQIAIPFDHVDPEDVARPIAWNMKLIERFMLIFGPLSSIFDFLTFYVLISVFGAGEKLFHTGWFIESLATQILVVFAIRTRRVLIRSRPHLALITVAALVIVGSTALAFLPLGSWLGFVQPPAIFFVYLIAATVAYLLLVEAAKYIFFRSRWLVNAPARIKS